MRFDRDYSIFIPYDSGGRVFVQDRRSFSKEGEEWGFFGGGVEAGESFEEALVREVKEELGADVSGRYEYVWETVLTLAGSWTQWTRIYALRDEGTDWRVIEWDGGEFMSLDRLAEAKLAPWSHICIDMLRSYLAPPRTSGI